MLNQKEKMENKSDGSKVIDKAGLIKQ